MAARSELITRLMTWYMRRLAKRRFHAVRIAKGCLPQVEANTAVVVYSNHPSWWDPLVFVLLQARVFRGRRGFGPMESRSLARYAVLRRMGVFELVTETKVGAVRFLQASRAILQTPRTVLWVTAEGRFTDPRSRPLQLQPGVAHLLHGQANVIAIPLALEYPFWNESAPEALLRFGTPLAAAPNRSVGEWQAVLSDALTATMDRLAEDAMARDPTPFDTLLGGRVGVGGLYDVWRSRTWLRGERPDLAHDPATR